MEENLTETESTISANGQEPPKETEAREETEPASGEQLPNESETVSNRETPISEQEEEGAAEPTAKQEDSFLTVRFNHQTRDLTRDEAVGFAQKGMLYDRVRADLSKVNPVYNKLDYLAAQQNTTPEALVEEMFRKQEEDYKNGLREKFGEQLDDETAEGLLDLFRQKQKTKYDKILSDRKKAAADGSAADKEEDDRRIAREFTQLQREFPEYETFRQLPDSVKQEAFEGKDLMTAMLRFEHEREKMKRQTAAAKLSAVKSSAGSQAQNGENESSVERSFVSGLWRRG